MIRIFGTPLDIVALSEMQKYGLKYVSSGKMVGEFTS
jgi:hypothetical protein